jgi:hypothetical protein
MTEVEMREIALSLYHADTFDMHSPIKRLATAVISYFDPNYFIRSTRDRIVMPDSSRKDLTRPPHPNTVASVLAAKARPKTPKKRNQGPRHKKATLAQGLQEFEHEQEPGIS